MVKSCPVLSTSHSSCGKNRAISSRHTGTTLAGQTTRCGRPSTGRVAQQGQHLPRLAQTHFVGEQTMAADVAEVVQPLDAAPLVGPQAFGQRGRRDGRGEHALAPRLDLGGKRDLEAVVVEQRKNEIGRQFAIGLDGLLDRAAPLRERLPLLGRERHDAEAGQDDGRAAAARVSTSTSSSVSRRSPARKIQRSLRPAPLRLSACASISTARSPFMRFAAFSSSSMVK